MKMLPTLSANDESIAPIGWPIVPPSRIAPVKRRHPDRQPQQRKPAPRDDKPRPG